MVYCSNCGTKLEDEAYFCFKCGTKTQAGKTAKAMYPSDELRDAFYQVGMELEKAFNMAAKETQAAFRRVSDEMQQKQQKTSYTSQTQNTVVCPKCGTKNLAGAVFCSNCGSSLAPVEESHGSV
jgi:ribosomal protein L40E